MISNSSRNDGLPFAVDVGPLSSFTPATAVTNINSFRVFKQNAAEPDPGGRYVLYWMQMNRRLTYNYALDYAVAWANKLGLPLLIYEALGVQNRWGSDRFIHFMLDGVIETAAECKARGVAYFPYLEDSKGASKGLIDTLVKDAALVISDEYPVYIAKSLNRYLRAKSPVAFITVDSNGIIPLGITEKAPYSAYIFRRVMQRHFVEAFNRAPKEDPLADLVNREDPLADWDGYSRWPRGERFFEDADAFVASIPIDHSVGKLDIRGTREAGLAVMRTFIDAKLMQYGEERSHPDLDKASRLSAWLHFGKVSEYEVVKAALERQPADWSVDGLRPVEGQRHGFFGGHPSIESFLDEVITWREVGFHFCHHTPNYDKFDSLPDWAIKTLEEHAADDRPVVYTYDQLEQSLTHDEVWNAAQRQLREEGIIQNYLRMLWGKKILEWAPDPRTALDWMIELNNKWAIDGRDPNSYSGIFWCLGRFDRPWAPQRPIFGQIRYMSTESTMKKLKLKAYLKRYSGLI